MAGTFTEGVSKVLSGVYTLITAVVASVKNASNRGVAAYPFTANWGPVNQLVETTNADDFEAAFNAGAAGFTAGKIKLHAFNGKPRKVLDYRMATNAAAKATAVLNDSGAAMSLTLQTLYPTTRAFTAVVAPAATGGKTVKIMEGAKELVAVTGTTVAEIVAALAGNAYVTVTASGANLPDDTAGVSFTGGNDGAAVTVTEYSNFLTELEADGTANAFALDAVTDEAILTVAETWLRRVRDEGNYITFARGGDASYENNGASAANTKSKATNYRGLINVGNGADGYTAAEIAIFAAARAASVALNASVTDEDTPYKAVNKKFTPAQRKACKQAGTFILVMEGDKVVIDEGVNTFTVVSDPDTENVAMGKIRVSNALDAVARDLEAFGQEFKKGRSNTDAAREVYAATIEEKYFKPLAAAEVIKYDYFYIPNPVYHGPTATQQGALDEAFFYSGITPIDSMERIYQKINVNF